MKDKEKINAVAEAVVKILEAEMKVPYGESDKEVKDGPAIRSHKAKPVDPKEYTDKLDKKYAKPSPFASDVKEASDLEEGSGPKEKQKTPYRNINSPEYRAAAEKQKDMMDKDDAATPGKKLMSRLKGKQYKLDKNRNGKLDAHDFKMLRGEKSVDEAALGVPLKGHPYHKKSDAELRYIQKDAGEAAKAMKGHSPKSEAKYLDQVNDASTVLHYRSKGGKQLAGAAKRLDKESMYEDLNSLSEKKGDNDLGTFTDNNMGEMTDAQMKERERIVKGMKKGLAGFKERYGKRAKEVMYATATKQAMKDEAVDPNVKTTDTLAGTIKGGEANQFKSYKVKLKAEEMGCENTPMSRATNLAKAAYKKLKNETMMGKAGGTSEEKK